MEEQEQETANAVEDQERIETQDLLEEQMKNWGSQKLQEREQMDKAIGSQILKIT